MKEIIKVENITKTVKNEKILKGIDLSIEKGEFISVVGASGSGKSSLLYILGLLDPPTSGKVIFEGKEINFFDQKFLAHIRNNKIGFVFQFHYLLPEFSAIENVIVPMIKAGKSIKDARKKAKDLLKMLGLEEKETRKPYQLSGGEQQRVAIARALANDPIVILADEPTGNLDSKNTEAVMNIFLDLNTSKKTTIVMVTHELELAKKTHKIVHIHDGKIIEIQIL